MIDFSTVKLGRNKRFPHEIGALPRLEGYYKAAPKPPSVIDWLTPTKISPGGWGLLANDRIGDCTAAGIYHSYMQRWAIISGDIVNLPDALPIGLYSATSPYPAKDEGTTCVKVLQYVAQNGLKTSITTDALDAIGGVEIDPSNLNYVDDAINWTGNVYIGLDLPVSAQAQIANGQVWDVTAGPDNLPGSWGGHCVIVGARDSNGLRYAVTWGMVQPMTEAFWLKYVVETYATIGRGDFFLTDGKTPGGLDWDQLNADLQNIAVANISM